MPAYISHAIMADQLYTEIASSSKVLKIKIYREELRGYSIVPDCASLSNRVIKDPHNFNTRGLFLSMINYIKDNKLTENSSIMALLYGHIAHYFFDINAHPLVYYIECGCSKIGLVPNHHLVEGYLSSHLTKTVLGKDIMDVNQDYFSRINLNDSKIAELINSSYGKIYGDYDMIGTYRTIMTILIKAETILKSGIFSKQSLINISCFDKFLSSNNLTRDEILNVNGELFMNPVTGDDHREKFMDLYDRAIDMSIDAIETVNKYLYFGDSVRVLDNVFTNLSYDTGVDCELGKSLVYTRK